MCGNIIEVYTTFLCFKNKSKEYHFNEIDTLLDEKRISVIIEAKQNLAPRTHLMS